MRICFVTTDPDRVGDRDVDLPFHERAFADTGVALVHSNWRDSDVDWSEFDLCVLRSPWDYAERRAEFLAWLDRVEPVARMENPPPVVRWNLDKRYLSDLERLAVPVIPTDYAASESDAADALAAHRGGEVVIKPVVSAGSRNTGRFAARDPAALSLVRTILDDGQLAMIQPFAASVGRVGETSLVLFNGAVSHSFQKGPILDRGGGFLSGRYRVEITPVVPSAEQLRVVALAEAARRSLCKERFGLESPLLYARYDLVTLDDGTDALLEAELFEPSFFLFVDASAPQRFLEAVLARL